MNPLKPFGLASLDPGIDNAAEFKNAVNELSKKAKFIDNEGQPLMLVEDQPDGHVVIKGKVGFDKNGVLWVFKPKSDKPDEFEAIDTQIKISQYAPVNDVSVKPLISLVHIERWKVNETDEAQGEYKLSTADLDLRHWKFKSIKAQGANKGSEFTGFYERGVGDEKITILSKRDTPAKDIAEFLGGGVTRILTDNNAAEVFLMYTQKGTYLGSVFLENFEDLYLDVYKAWNEHVKDWNELVTKWKNDERDHLLVNPKAEWKKRVVKWNIDHPGQPQQDPKKAKPDYKNEKDIPTSRPRNVGTRNKHPFYDIISSDRYDRQSLTDQLAARLRYWDFDMHFANLGRHKSSKDAKKGILIASIDYAGGYKDMKGELHPHSHWHHFPIKIDLRRLIFERQPSNHFREYPRPVRVSWEMLRSLHDQCSEEKHQAILQWYDDAFAKINEFYDARDVADFAERLGINFKDVVISDELLESLDIKNKDDKEVARVLSENKFKHIKKENDVWVGELPIGEDTKNSVIEITKDYLKKLEVETRLSLQRFAREIEIDLYIKKDAKGEYYLDERINKLIAADPAYFRHGDFHFRAKEHKGDFFDRHFTHNTKDKLTKLLVGKARLYTDPVHKEQQEALGIPVVKSFEEKEIEALISQLPKESADGKFDLKKFSERLMRARQLKELSHYFNNEKYRKLQKFKRGLDNHVVRNWPQELLGFFEDKNTEPDWLEKLEKQMEWLSRLHKVASLLDTGQWKELIALDGTPEDEARKIRLLKDCAENVVEKNVNVFRQYLHRNQDILKNEYKRVITHKNGLKKDDTGRRSTSTSLKMEAKDAVPVTQRKIGITEKPVIEVTKLAPAILVEPVKKIQFFQPAEADIKYEHRTLDKTMLYNPPMQKAVPRTIENKVINDMAARFISEYSGSTVYLSGKPELSRKTAKRLLALKLHEYVLQGNSAAVYLLNTKAVEQLISIQIYNSEEKTWETFSPKALERTDILNIYRDFRRQGFFTEHNKMMVAITSEPVAGAKVAVGSSEKEAREAMNLIEKMQRTLSA